MLKFDLGAKTLSPMAKSTMADASFLERGDLQQAIQRSWDAFRNEMGMPELILLGEEIAPHGSCKDRIDLLALDAEGRPVIIELKRGRERLQLMQAIAYAGMVAGWDEAEFRHRIPMGVVRQAERARQPPGPPQPLTPSPGLGKAGDVVLAWSWSSSQTSPKRRREQRRIERVARRGRPIAGTPRRPPLALSERSGPLITR